MTTIEINRERYIQGMLNDYGFEKKEEADARKRWYSFAGRFAKLTDAEVEALEFSLYNLYGEHLKLTPHKEMDMQDIADEYNEIGQEAFMNKYGNK